MRIEDVARCAEALAGVRRSSRDGLTEWRYQGRRIARQLDDEHVAIRCEFGYRDALLRQSPETFTVPARFVKHMMVVTTLSTADPGAVEDAIEAAWQLQRASGGPRRLPGHQQ